MQMLMALLLLAGAFALNSVDSGLPTPENRAVELGFKVAEMRRHHSDDSSLKFIQAQLDTAWPYLRSSNPKEHALGISHLNEIERAFTEHSSSLASESMFSGLSGMFSSKPSAKVIGRNYAGRLSPNNINAPLSPVMNSKVKME